MAGLQKTIKALVKKEVGAKKYLWDLAVLLVGVGVTLMVTELLPVLYWPGVICVYFGSLLFAVHVYVDDQLLRSANTRKGLAIIGLVIVWYLWSTRIVFIGAPVNEFASATIGNYPPYVSIAGINWDANHYVDVRVDLGNPTDYAYKDVDIEFASDITIWGAAQITDLPGVSFFREESRSPFSSAWINGTDNSGKPVSIPMPIPIDMSKPTGFRLSCDKFPRHSTMKIVLAMVALNYGPPPLPKQMFAAKRLPHWLKVTEEYRAIGRTRHVLVTNDFTK